MQVIRSTVFKNLTFIVKHVSETEKTLSKIVVQPNTVLTPIYKHVEYYLCEQFFTSDIDLDLKSCEDSKDLRKLNTNYKHVIDTDSINKYFVNDTEVDCMTFINAFEDQPVPTNTKLKNLTNNICGYNIVIDTVEHVCKLVKLNCTGCIFTRQSEDMSIDVFNSYLQTCYRCICCIDCYNSESCKYCFNCKMMKNCNNCVLSNFCDNCNYCIKCELCRSCDKSYLITYSNSIESCVHINYSQSCKNSKDIEYCKKITNSSSIYYSNDVVKTYYAEHSHEITNCDTCFYTNCAFECRQTRCCEYIKFCSHTHYCKSLVCCNECHCVDHCVMLDESQFCYRCAIGRSILYCIHVYCCDNAKRCYGINTRAYEQLYGKDIDIWIHFEEPFKFQTVNTGEGEILIDKFEKILDKMLQHMAELERSCCTIDNTYVKKFIKRMFKIINFVNDDPSMIFTPEEQNNDNKNVYNVQKIMDKISEGKKFIETYIVEHPNDEDLWFFNDDKNLFFLILKLISKYRSSLDTKNTEYQNICIEMIQMLFNLNLYYSNNINACTDCSCIDNCTNDYKCYNMIDSHYCYNCNNMTTSLHCKNCVDMDSCRYAISSDNCDDVHSCMFASHCSDTNFVYYECPYFTQKNNNNNESKTIIDCPCGCGKRIEIDSNKFYRVYDKDNYLVYIGTQHIGYVYHETSYQVYKKCYFKTSIDIEKYFENDEYFVSMATDNYLYADTYDRNGTQVSVDVL